MSRRKQSNPKPLKAGEEEEWGSEGEADRASTEGKTPSTPAPSSTPAEPPSAPSTPPTPAPGPASPPASASSAGPKLRLNASLATDPALRPGAAAAPAVVKTEPPQAPASPADLEYLASLPSALQTAIVAGRLFCVPPLSSAENAAASGRKSISESSDSRQASVPVYICNPCGIKFSSPSTLEAHQTYYCSHRHATQAKVAVASGAGSGGGGAESEPEDVKPVLETREDVSGGESSTGEPATKSIKSGKQYRCPHCSYSADKKVSLNRHMRMHSSSPASQTGSTTEASDSLVDRYCQDCDIRFSSMKTFKAHKMHYCSTRHVIKSGKPISAPSSPSESRTTPTSPGASDTSNHLPREGPSQPFLALPTNPVLIVPYSLFQGASILSGPAVMGFPAQDTACLLLPDGTLQPLAQGLIPLPRPSPQIPPEAPPKRHRNTSETIVKKPEEARNKNGLSEPPSGAPLDLSVRPRDEEGDLVIDMEEEDEKENRQSVDNQPNIFPSPDPEDIICAPSIPLLLSTSSTCSSPSPAPPSPALSSSSYSAGNRKPQESNKRQRSDSQSSSPSPKSSPSGTKSPRRTPNGLPNIADKKLNESNRKSSADAVTSPPKLDNGNNNITLSSLLLAAAAQSQIDGFPGKSESLPFPPDLVSHLTGSRVPGGKGKPIPALPALIPAAGRNLPILLPKPPRTPADLMNPASILPLLTPEMALRIAAATGNDPSSPMPQVLVKQGVSKCNECNIVFCKHENYVAHKKHYCAARQVNEPIIVQDDDKPGSPALSTSPSNTASPPATAKEQPHSPVNATAASASSASKPTLYQFICAACGIKFTSYDNLTAHQVYYCPKRASVEEKGSRRCAKCKHTVPMDHVCGSAGGQWKCPCCPVVSPTASAAQKHMDTHTGVKAFLCTICRYKGNTLRGMRTHIRMHFEKRSNEIMEENYITCLLEDGAGGCIELPSMDNEEWKGPTAEQTQALRSMNGDSASAPAKVKVKEEVERRLEEEEEDEEYIEVDEVNIKTEPQDCKDTKNVMLRRSDGVVANLARGVQVHR